MLKRYGSLRHLASLDADELSAVTGVGPARSTRLAATFEIGRRIESSSCARRPRLRSPSEVAAHFAPAMRDLQREIFRVVLLNSASRIIRDFTASEGGLAASIVEPRIVFRRAILSHAASIICLHNHPSGNLEPSPEDLRITRQLVSAGSVVGVPLRDHVIIAGDGYTSLAERGHI
jgi:DNA repair protein RadC